MTDAQEFWGRYDKALTRVVNYVDKNASDRLIAEHLAMRDPIANLVAARRELLKAELKICDHALQVLLGYDAFEARTLRAEVEELREVLCLEVMDCCSPGPSTRGAEANELGERLNPEGRQRERTPRSRDVNGPSKRP